MKRFCTFITSLLLITAFSNADQILIYKGAETDRSYGDGTPTKELNSYFWLLDLTTLNFNSIYFTGSGKHKSYVVYSTDYPFSVEPITLPHNVTQTNFVYTYQNELSLGFAGGVNSSVQLSSTSTGSYPKVLNYQEHDYNNQGTAATNYYENNSGVYRLDLALTQQSNNATTGGDDLTGADAVVTSYLASHGYRPGL